MLVLYGAQSGLYDYRAGSNDHGDDHLNGVSFDTVGLYRKGWS